MKKWKNISLGWMAFVVFSDLFFMIVLLVAPNSVLYDLATEYKWGITPSWAGTTIAAILVMSLIVWSRITIDPKLNNHEYTVLAFISLVWVVELVVYESLIGAFHWTKIVDAIRWFTFFLAARYVNNYDNTH